MPTDPLLQFFAYGHLPPAAQAVSRPFCELAQYMVDVLPDNPERSAGLGSLLETKDHAVRASLYKATAADGLCHHPVGEGKECLRRAWHSGDHGDADLDKVYAALRADAFGPPKE